jgi:DNA primase
MYSGTRQKQTSVYTSEQVKRSIVGSGISIENEVDSDYIIFCPYHNNYRTPAGEVSKNSGMFFCFSCHESRTLVEFVMYITKKTYFESVRFIDSMKVEESITNLIDNILVEKVEFKSFDKNTISKLHQQALDSKRALEYYEGRNISIDSVNKFILGYSEKQDMVTIPLLDPSGTIFLGFIARSVEGKEFKNTPGLPKSKSLFNLHRAKKYDTVYVVESSFDAIRLDQNGAAAIATLGSNIPNTQIELLKKYFNNIIVIGDNDEAGRSMQQRIFDKVGKRATLISIPERFKDVGDMKDSDIQELITRIKDPLLSIY